MNSSDRTLPATRQALIFMLLLAGAVRPDLALSAPEEFIIDPNHTYATFEVRHLGISTQRGRFNRNTGKAILDAGAESGKVEINIDARTIDTGSEAMEKLLRGGDFFNVEKFPDITFQSQTVVFIEGKPASIEGKLTLLGVARPVTLTVTGYACTRLPFLVKTTCGLDAVTTIHRSEFGMTSLLSFVGDDVTLRIQAEAVREDQPQPAPPGS